MIIKKEYPFTHTRLNTKVSSSAEEFYVEDASSSDSSEGLNEKLLLSPEEKLEALSLVCEYLYDNLAKRNKEDQSGEDLKSLLSARCANRDIHYLVDSFAYNFILDNVIASLMQQSFQLLRSYAGKKAKFKNSYSPRRTLVLSDRFLTECLENINYTIDYLSDRKPLRKTDRAENTLSEFTLFNHPFDEHAINNQPHPFCDYIGRDRGGILKPERLFKLEASVYTILAFIVMFIPAYLLRLKYLSLQELLDRGPDNYSSTFNKYSYTWEMEVESYNSKITTGWAWVFAFSIPAITFLAIYFCYLYPASSPYAIEPDLFGQLEASLEKPKEEQALFLLYMLENMSEILIQQGCEEEIDERLEDVLSILRLAGNEDFNNEQERIEASPSI